MVRICIRKEVYTISCTFLLMRAVSGFMLPKQENDLRYMYKNIATDICTKI